MCVCRYVVGTCVCVDSAIALVAQPSRIELKSHILHNVEKTKIKTKRCRDWPIFRK